MEHQSQQIRIADYTYTLPEEKIALFPIAKRDDSKLLVYKSGKISNSRFYQLPEHLPPHATLVVNNTRVIEARLLFKKPTGGVIEVFCLEPHDTGIEAALRSEGTSTWRCLVGGASKWKRGQVLNKEMPEGRLTATYVGQEPDHFIIRFDWEPAHQIFAEVLHQTGAMPLPPYIKRAAGADDSSRYQTVFARADGSVAAPTAALHFTDETFAALAQKGIHTAPVTLHVGAGTFKPVKSETIGEHPMHAEHFQVSQATLRQLLAAEDIVAVGTTSLRTLESLYWIGLKLIQGVFLPDQEELELNQWECYDLDSAGVSYKQSLSALLQHLHQKGQELLFCRTSLIIVPGYEFRSAIALVTNFHQPQSTLLLLVAAFIGEDWRKVYEHALEQEYRFLSYGDSSLLFRNAEQGYRA